MFKLVRYFIKTIFISFYEDGEFFVVKKTITYKNKIIKNHTFKFRKNVFKEFINLILIEYNQVYISTFVDSFNQGIALKKSDEVYCLDLENYCIYVDKTELNQFYKKMRQFKVDFIFSPYLLLHFIHRNKPNTIYLIITPSFVILTIYENRDYPKYSKTYPFKIDIDIENGELVEFLKYSIKEYYENYSDNFLENIYIFYDDIKKEFIDCVKNEVKLLGLDVESKNIDVLLLLNQIAQKELNV